MPRVYENDALRQKAGWSNTEFWLRRQTTYDSARARKREHQIDVARHEPRGGGLRLRFW